MCKPQKCVVYAAGPSGTRGTTAAMLAATGSPHCMPQALNTHSVRVCCKHRDAAAACKHLHVATSARVKQYASRTAHPQT
jgi:hypothetical protein